MRKVLVDTNLLIRAFDPKASATPEQVADACIRLLNLIDDPEVSLVLNPLILFEVTCGIEFGDEDRLDALQARLNRFDMIAVGEAEARFAARLSRYARTEDIVLDKRRKFDLLNFASAKINNLEIETADLKDFDTINNAFRKLTEQDSLDAKTPRP